MKDAVTLIFLVVYRWTGEGDKVLWTAKDERFAMLILSVTGWFSGTSYGLVGAHAKASIDSHGRIFSFYIAHQYTKLSFPSTAFDFYITIHSIGCRYSKQSRESTEGCLFQTALNLESKPFLFSAYCCAVPKRNVFLAPGLLIWKVSFSHAFPPSSFCTCAALHYRAFWPSPFDHHPLTPRCYSPADFSHQDTLTTRFNMLLHHHVKKHLPHIHSKQDEQTLFTLQRIYRTNDQRRTHHTFKPPKTDKQVLDMPAKWNWSFGKVRKARSCHAKRTLRNFIHRSRKTKGRQQISKKALSKRQKTWESLAPANEHEDSIFGTATKPCACHAKWTLQDFCFFVITCAFFGGSLFRDLANSSQACFGQRSCEFVSRDCVGFFDDLYVYVFLLPHCLGWWVAPKSTSGVGGSFPRRDAKKKISKQSFTQYIIRS